MYDPRIDALLQFDLTKVIEDMVYYVDLIDNNFHEKPNNFIMKYWQSQNVNLKSALLTDLLDWLCCLSLSDGFVAREEVQFINIHLKQRLSVNNILEICRERIDEDYFNRLPLSFILLYEDDMVMNNLEGRIIHNNVKKLYDLFMIIGIQFISCDNDIDLKEMVVFKRYTEDLLRRIQNFDLKLEQLKALEALAIKLEEVQNNVNSFSENSFNDYYDRISELESLANIKGETQTDNTFSDISVNPWEDKINNIQTNPWQSVENKSNSPWDLEINPNENYSFSGEFSNHLNDFKDIFTPENHQILENNHLTPIQYRSILNKMSL